jgi:nitroreductase/NAD-dependent dihydropyrimidine dehydrogenase PreA subunit
MDIIRIDRSTCQKCGTCSATCPRGIIDFNGDDFPAPSSLADLMCTRCGHCVTVCPTGSLSHREMSVKHCPPMQTRLEVGPEQCEHFLRSRRSVRVFKNVTVPRDVIARLIKVARYAPTGHNMQEVEWLVIDNKEQLGLIEETGVEWTRWQIGNETDKAKKAALQTSLKRSERTRNRLLRGAPALLVTHARAGNLITAADCTIALTFLDLAAKSQGLGCCWAGLVYMMANGYPPAQRALPVPEGHAVHGCMMLGYPRFSFQRLPTRLEPKITWSP